MELGYQLSLSGEFDSAVQAYQAAAKANEGDVRAMTGVVYCQVRQRHRGPNAPPVAPADRPPARRCRAVTLDDALLKARGTDTCYGYGRCCGYGRSVSPTAVGRSIYFLEPPKP